MNSILLAIPLSIAAACGLVACSDGASPEGLAHSSDPATSMPDGGAGRDGSSGSSGSSSDLDGAAPTEAGADGGDVMEAGADVDAGDPGPAPFSQAEVQAIVNARCIGCHSGGSPSAGMNLAGDFTLVTVGVTSVEAAPLKRIAAGNRAQSYLFHKLAGTHLTVGGAGERMPRGGPYLSDLDIERVGRFIDGL